MNFSPELLLIGAVVGVGILHTIVPDHWVPITLIARQQGWSRGETAQAAVKAGTGHVLSTLVIGLIVWIAGVAFAARFGNAVSIASSLALIGFGGWISIGSLREMRAGAAHTGGHGGHHHGSSDEALRDNDTIGTPNEAVRLSIFESGTPARFRLAGPDFGTIAVETIRDDGSRQSFAMTNLGPYWESLDVIPEPHQFTVSLTVSMSGRIATYDTRFEEHGHDDHDALYKPLVSASAASTHAHRHRHVNSAPHSHRHDHDAATWHRVTASTDSEAPRHKHGHKTSSRMALLLILGSSPMVEGIPAFFAAGKYGPGLIAVMSVAFGLSTIITYVALCVYSTAGLQRVNLRSFEKYGEVISGAFIALVGIVFLVFPIA